MENIYITVQKFGVGTLFYYFFFMFLKEVYYAHQSCIYLIKNIQYKQ